MYMEAPHTSDLDQTFDKRLNLLLGTFGKLLAHGESLFLHFFIAPVGNPDRFFTLEKTLVP